MRTEASSIRSLSVGAAVLAAYLAAPADAQRREIAAHPIALERGATFGFRVGDRISFPIAAALMPYAPGLRARVFRGRKADLPFLGRLDASGCLEYESSVYPIRSSDSRLQVAATDERWLVPGTDDRVGPGVFVVVLESGGLPSGAFRIRRESARSYFEVGVEFSVTPSDVPSREPPAPESHTSSSLRVSYADYHAFRRVERRPVGDCLWVSSRESADGKVLLALGVAGAGCGREDPVLASGDLFESEEVAGTGQSQSPRLELQDFTRSFAGSRVARVAE